MKKLILPSLLIALLILGCTHKKDDPTPDNIVPATTLYADLEVSANLWFKPGIFTLRHGGSAAFLDNQQKSLKVGSVSINGVNLDYDSTRSSYKIVFISDTSKFVWDVKGKNGIPDFNYSVIFKFPEFDFLLLPDSLDVSKNLTVPLFGIKNADSLLVGISCFSNPKINFTTQKFSASTSSVTIDSTVLKKFINEQNIYLSVELFKLGDKQQNGNTLFSIKKLFSANKSVKLYE